MKKSTDILIIGGGPAGVISATTARKYYSDKKITLLKNVENGVIPCGIPYMFATLKSPDENKMGNLPLEKNNIDFFVDEAIEINAKEKIVKTKNNDEYSYEKLILAMGSSPCSPPIEGIEKEGIYHIHKNMDYLKACIKKIQASKSVLIIGGGFIGVEFADEVAKIKDCKVYLIEFLPNLLENSFDMEFSKMAEEKLKSKNVTILTNTKVVKFEGSDKVEKVILSDGTEINVDSVIMGIGARANVDLAKNAGLKLDEGKGILVDDYMRTSDTDILAVGDCAGKRDLLTQRRSGVMLASTATAEARIAGSNLYKLKVIRANKGTIAIYSTYIDGLVLGSAGLTEKTAKKDNFEFITGNFEGFDKHPGTLPNTSKIKIKLIFSRDSGIILGGQVSGGISCGEMINTIGMAITKKVSFSELEILQMATHPHLTSAPTLYPIVLAAQDAAQKA
jgi:NADH oxidase (H2O2-forming)